MKTASAIVEDMLSVLRRQFYADRTEKRWHFERELLVRAVTHPAWVLEKRGAALPAERYQAILQGVIRTIQQHGAAHEARNFGRYFLTCVQRHMDKHWATYYDQAKAVRTALDKELQRAGERRDSDSTVSALAEAHKALLVPKGGRRKKGEEKARRGIQQELF